LSVDGLHCRVKEPRHPTLRRDPAYFSYKHKTAGVTYELALDLHKPKLVWINGPFPASKHDKTIFEEGLMKKIPQGKFVIADLGYKDKKLKHVISIASSLDSDNLRKFKSRAR